MLKPIYFDYAATTPVDPRVTEKMTECLSMTGVFGNASSSHYYGVAAKEKAEEARHYVADLIHADPAEIIWTSGATEANNLALKGAAALYNSKGKHIITVQTEHPSVLDCCKQLDKEGYQVTYLAPEKNGLLDIEKLKTAIRSDTILVSVMHVNNEIGVIQNIESIAELTTSLGILFHVDAAQSAGKLAINLKETPIDLMSFAAHKIYGPKGIGALYLRRKPRVRVATQIHGGGQEQGMRSGTLATHQIVGMGEAFRLAKIEMAMNQKKIADLRLRFIHGLRNHMEITINGDERLSLPNILNVNMGGIKAETFIQQFPELAISAGSACFSKGVEPSYVLRALGQSTAEAYCGVRFSFGQYNTEKDIDRALELIANSVIY